jgi:hypothetical protein
MTGESEIVSTRGHKFYPTRPEVPYQHYHGSSGCNTYVINIIL